MTYFTFQKLIEISSGTNVDKKNLEPAHKEVYKLLENDQFPRFRRSELYLGFLEQLLPKSYAEKWANSFDALIGNQVGRHYFREFLFSIHAEENLRFWEAIIEFKGTRNRSQAMLNMARSIHDQFLKEGCTNEVRTSLLRTHNHTHCRSFCRSVFARTSSKESKTRTSI